MEEALNLNGIDSYILKEENLLWKGKPVKEIGTLPNEKFNIILGIFWTVFSIFWISLSIVIVTMSENEGFSFSTITPVFGVPMLAFGIYLIFISPRIRKNKRKNTQYALTSKRILILSGDKTQVLRAFKYNEIQNITFGCDEQGVGAVTFVNNGNASTTSNGQKKTRMPKGEVYGFYNIDDVKKVYEIFCKLTGEKQI